jgi:hypothetical protein
MIGWCSAEHERKHSWQVRIEHAEGCRKVYTFGKKKSFVSCFYLIFGNYDCYRCAGALTAGYPHFAIADLYTLAHTKKTEGTSF